MLNGLRTSQPIDFSLMMFDTDKQREMGEEWDFTLGGTGMTVSEVSVHSLIKKKGDMVLSWSTDVKNQSGTTHEETPSALN